MKLKASISHVMLGAMAVVALSTTVMPYITGYGTLLFQVVGFSAWGIVAAITSGKFADQHHAVVWPTALLINLVMFSIPALLPYWVGKRKSFIFGAVGIVAWLALYLGMLFVLFPATDGP